MSGKVRYRNEYVKQWGERAAAARYRLRPKEQYAYDGVAASDSPDPLEPGDWVEVKTCKRWVENGDEYGTAGRWYITESSHEKLLNAGGYYALIVYDIVEDGGERMLIHAMRLVPAADLDAYLLDSPRLPYPEIFPEVHPRNNERCCSEEPEAEPEPAGESEPEERGFPKAISNEERYPTDLRERDIWLIWCFDSEGRKVPRAPWMTDTCYPVSWGADADRRPETTFEEAHKWSGFRGTDVGNSWPFPDDAEDKNLKLGMLLPHEPPEPPIMQVDLDNVRNPETGAITPESRGIMEMFPHAYAQISTSGTGIHLYVRASLPERMGKFIETIELLPRRPEFEALDEAQQIELYDHGRFVAITGEHIEGAGTGVPEAQERIEEVIEEYETENASGSSGREATFDPSQHRNPNRTSNSNRSPYYDEPIANFGEPRANPAPTGEGFGGAHPGHGGTASSDSSSTNYAVNTTDNIWHCFAHQSGGGPLSLVAVMENELDCSYPRLNQLSDEAFARVCLAARDSYGFSGDPPYRAVVGVARSQGLAMADYEEGILGSDCYEIARQIYDNIRASEI
jgi:hypothetical protein